MDGDESDDDQSSNTSPHKGALWSRLISVDHYDTLSLVQKPIDNDMKKSLKYIQELQLDNIDSSSPIFDH